MGPQFLLQLRVSTYSAFTGRLWGCGELQTERAFDSEVSWEGASGVVVIVRFFLHRWNICVGSKPVPLILSHSS